MVSFFVCFFFCADNFLPGLMYVHSYQSASKMNREERMNEEWRDGMNEVCNAFYFEPRYVFLYNYLFALISNNLQLNYIYSPVIFCI